MKRVVSIIAIFGLLTLSLCTVMDSGVHPDGNNAMQMEHGAGHGQPHHGLSEMSMGCCAVVSGGAIVPGQTFIPLFLAGIAFLMVFNFFVPQQLYLHLYRPPRSLSLFQ